MIKLAKDIIDVSYHQGNINFSAMKPHVSAVILRVQDGGFADPKYSTYAKSCVTNKIPYGVYAFCRYSDNFTAIAEARRFYSRATINGLEPNFYFLDVETTGTAKLRSATEAFRKELIRLGAKKVGIYIAHHLRANSSIDFSKFDKVWIPRYSGNKPAFACDLHQYTEHGRIAGVAGNVDRNVIMKGDASWYTSSINGSKPITKPTKPVSKPNKPAKAEYYHMAPNPLKSKTTIGVYRDKAFKNKVRTYPKGTRFNNVKLVKYGNITRFQLDTKEELYITANKAFVEAVYYAKGTAPKQVETTKTLYLYKSPEFTKDNRVKKFPKGTVFTITGIAHSKAGTPRLTINSNGKTMYITADKEFYKKLK